MTLILKGDPSEVAHWLPFAKTKAAALENIRKRSSKGTLTQIFRPTSDVEILVTVSKLQPHKIFITAGATEYEFFATTDGTSDGFVVKSSGSKVYKQTKGKLVADGGDLPYTGAEVLNHPELPGFGVNIWYNPATGYSVRASIGPRYYPFTDAVEDGRVEVIPQTPKVYLGSAFVAEGKDAVISAVVQQGFCIGITRIGELKIWSLSNPDVVYDGLVPLPAGSDAREGKRGGYWTWNKSGTRCAVTFYGDPEFYSETQPRAIVGMYSVELDVTEAGEFNGVDVTQIIDSDTLTGTFAADFDYFADETESEAFGGTPPEFVIAMVVVESLVVYAEGTSINFVPQNYNVDFQAPIWRYAENYGVDNLSGANWPVYFTSLLLVRIADDEQTAVVEKVPLQAVSANPSTQFGDPTEGYAVYNGALLGLDLRGLAYAVRRFQAMSVEDYETVQGGGFLDEFTSWPTLFGKLVDGGVVTPINNTKNYMQLIVGAHGASYVLENSKGDFEFPTDASFPDVQDYLDVFVSENVWGTPTYLDRPEYWGFNWGVSLPEVVASMDDLRDYAPFNIPCADVPEMPVYNPTDPTQLWLSCDQWITPELFYSIAQTGSEPDIQSQLKTIAATTETTVTELQAFNFVRAHLTKKAVAFNLRSHGGNGGFSGEPDDDTPFLEFEGLLSFEDDTIERNTLLEPAPQSYTKHRDLYAKAQAGAPDMPDLPEESTPEFGYGNQRFASGPALTGEWVKMPRKTPPEA